MPQDVGTINIEAHAGTDFLYTFPTTRDNEGVLVDALWSGRMQVRDSLGVLKSEAAVTVSNTGKPQVYIRRQDVEAPGQYFYDLILRSPLGLHFKRYSGGFKVGTTVTQWSEPAPDWGIPPSGATVRSPITLNVAADNQTVFTLPVSPPAPTRTALMVNGVEYDFLSSYSLSSYQLTWLDTPFQLKAGYRVKLYY